jgi:hypothetical protein
MELARPLRALVDELPRAQLPELKGLLEARLCREMLTPVPAAATPPADGGLRSTKAAAAYLNCSPWEIRDRAQRGELVGIQSKSGGRWQFELDELERYKTTHRRAGLANGVDLRYTPPHEPHRRPRAAARPRVDAAPARGRPQRNRDDRRPLGTRAAHHHPTGRNEPFAPGQAAWTSQAPARAPTDPETEG